MEKLQGDVSVWYKHAFLWDQTGEGVCRFMGAQVVKWKEKITLSIHLFQKKQQQECGKIYIILQGTQFPSYPNTLIVSTHTSPPTHTFTHTLPPMLFQCCFVC